MSVAGCARCGSIGSLRASESRTTAGRSAGRSSCFKPELERMWVGHPIRGWNRSRQGRGKPGMGGAFNPGSKEWHPGGSRVERAARDGGSLPRACGGRARGGESGIFRACSFPVCGQECISRSGGEGEGRSWKKGGAEGTPAPGWVSRGRIKFARL